MRFEEYLLEKDISFDAVKNILKRKCKPFLNELIPILKKSNAFSVSRRGTDGMFLFSGREKPEGDYFVKKIRKGRMPKDTPPEVQEFIDDQFEERFGVRPRGNGLFCTSKIEDASKYGISYIIFPIGDYKIVWSDKVSDFYNEVFDKDIDFSLLLSSSASTDLFDEQVYKDEWMVTYRDEGWWEFEDKHSTESDAEQAAEEIAKEIADEEGREVDDVFPEVENNLEFNAPVSFEEFLQTKVEEEQEKERDKLENILEEYQTGNLDDAIKSGNEVMLLGDKYLGVKFDMMDELLKWMEGELI